jgi:hypothetical protein
MEEIIRNNEMVQRNDEPIKYINDKIEKIGYTEESPGVRSSTRFVFLIGSMATIVLSGYMCYRGEKPIDIGVFMGVAISAFGGAKYFGTKNEGK